MQHRDRSVMTHRRLLLFKWLMVFIPPVTVAVGHLLLEYRAGLRRHAENSLVTLLSISIVTVVALVLAYIFVETLFRVLSRLQGDALARDQDILTMNAVMRERERMSRELHDGAAQLVAHLLLRLDTIQELVVANREREAHAELERLHGIADEIYQDIGESITGIRADMTERGLTRTLQDYLAQFEDRHQISVSLQADPAADRFPPLASFQIFRLIQEALTNVRKHAGARAATITLTSDGPNQLRIAIADDGHGFTPDGEPNGNAGSLGLTSMRERVEALDGDFKVNSQPGSGTQVIATVPVPRTRREDERAAVTNPAG